MAQALSPGTTAGGAPCPSSRCLNCADGLSDIRKDEVSVAKHHHGSLGKRPRSPGAEPRTRVSQACKACAASKVKCDEEKVCRRCIKKGIICHRSPKQAEGVTNAYAHTNPVERSSSDSFGLQGILREGAAGETELLSPSTQLQVDTSKQYDILDLNENPEFSFELGDLESLNSFLTFAHKDMFQGFDLSMNHGADPTDDILDLRVTAFKRSVWCYVPESLNYQVVQQPDLAPTLSAFGRLENLGKRCSLVLGKRLVQKDRDRVLAMILGSCEPAYVSKIVESFPSIEFLEGLMQAYLSYHASMRHPWIHIPSFRPSEICTEFLGAVIAAGAVRTNIDAVRKLGFALHDLSRLKLCGTWEQNIMLTRSLQQLQAYALLLDIGLWSGDKRKMEMAESLQQPLINMLRRAGRFRSSYYPHIALKADFDKTTLDMKWQQWSEGESYKRLVYHCFIHDSQSSIMLSTGSTISYWELDLGFPSSENLWTASSSKNWAQNYLQTQVTTNGKELSVLATTKNPLSLRTLSPAVNVETAQISTLWGIWSQVREFRQAYFSVGGVDENQSYQEPQQQRLQQVLQEFRFVHLPDCSIVSSPQALLVDLLSMHLYGPFGIAEDLAGKGGKENAKAAFAYLKSSIYKRQLRQSLHHAARVLRIIQRMNKEWLENFHAIAAYQASLCLWSFAISSDETAEIDPTTGTTSYICIDDEESYKTKRWVSLAEGDPRIRVGEEGEAGFATISMHDPKAIMDMTYQILIQKFASRDGTLCSLLESVARLIQNLGNSSYTC